MPWLAGLLALLALALPVAARAAERIVTIVNASPQPLDELYAVPVPAAPKRAPNLLAAGGLDPGAVTRVPVGGGCAFDLSAIYEDGRRETKRRNLCRDRSVTFSGAGAVAAPLEGDRVMVLANASPLPIVRLFVSPPNAPAWHASRLGGLPVPPAMSADLTFDGPCAQDVRVVFDNGAAEERRVDLCGRPELRIAPGWTTAPPPAGPAPEASTSPSAEASP